ncbi:MAG: AEC family transporter [Armatimonadota bacterium]
MPNWLIILLKIVAMFLVILVGWLARRRAYLTPETTGTLSRFVVDITMPAMVFPSMLATVNLSTLRESWFLPLLGVVIVVLGWLVGLATAPLFSPRSQRNTYIFLVAISNWVYLPLPIVYALYGSQGVAILFLINVGSVATLWTLGIRTLRGGKLDGEALWNIVKNPGLLATVAGVIAALLIPGFLSQALTDTRMIPLPPMMLTAKTLIEAMVMVGSLTIPLSLVLTGAQLGELDLSDHRPSRALVGSLLARLLVVPVVMIGLFALVAAHFNIPAIPRLVGYIIAAMPAAVSCGLFTERYGGDTQFASKAIFYGTLLSIATVPALLYIIQQFNL